MSTDTATSGAGGLSEYWIANRHRLFLASCIALIVTAMSFAIRGDIITQIGPKFGLTKEQLGWISGTAFWGFTLAMIFGGPLCDILGMGRLMILAFVGHAVGIVMTIFAHNYWTFFFSTLAFGLANGFVEAACNPLIATLYPDEKIKRLNLFHVWFPGGVFIGGLTAYALTRFGIGGEDHGWQIKMATMLLPLVIYGFLFLGHKFPVTERVASGISMGEMFAACFRPFFLVFVVCMLMTAVTELGPGQWIPNILTFTTGWPGILFLAWINGLMAIGRTTAGALVHRISPVGVLFSSSLFATVGVFLLSRAQSGGSALVAATIFAIGVCFFWPTMLGVVSERFPKTGALGLAIMGGAGNLSVGMLALPYMGHIYDDTTMKAANMTAAQYTAPGAQVPPDAQAQGGAAALASVILLPIILSVVFGLILLYDKSRGGYHKEILVQDQRNPDSAPSGTTTEATAK